MNDNELIEILKEFDEKRVGQLNDNARNLFNAIMDISNQRDRLLEEKQELINYLKQEDKELKENVVNLEAKLRNTPRDSFYYNSYLKTLHRFRAKRELIRKILSKIEKSDK